jgi:hypothetical protein
MTRKIAIAACSLAWPFIALWASPSGKVRPSPSAPLTIKLEPTQTAALFDFNVASAGRDEAKADSAKSGARTSARRRPADDDREAKLIAVLKSDAPLKDKADACRGLADLGTKNSVVPLAALLGDEKLSHMARYALEPIPDPSVDDALRAALGNVKGRQLVGVIGSIGVRRDAKATPALASLLKDSDADVAQAAARALGMIGTASAAKVLQDHVTSAAAANRPAFYEGLFRCAEALMTQGQRGDAIAIYESSNRAEAPAQVRDAAARKVRALRQEHGPTL